MTEWSAPTGNAASTWQRWTVDEIDGDVVRLAVAKAHVSLESSVAEAVATRAQPREIRRRVFAVEEADPELLWTAEEIAFARVDELRPLLKQRNEIRGLPDDRPLREGDVFWVVLPQPMILEGTAAVRSIALEWTGAQVWDVTAAARQVAKRTYDAAVRAASPEEERSGSQDGQR